MKCVYIQSIASGIHAPIKYSGTSAKTPGVLNTLHFPKPLERWIILNVYFHSLENVHRYRDSQLQVTENYLDLVNLKLIRQALIKCR